MSLRSMWNEQWTDLKKTYHETPPVFRRQGVRLFGGAVVLVLGIAAWKMTSVTLEARARKAEAEAGPRVEVARVVTTPPTRTVVGIGEARPYASVTLYAKVSGYLREVRVDKGEVVKKDQVLAVIESPETDKQFNAAAADAKNKRRIAGRLDKLKSRQLVSEQEAEQAESDAEIAQSRLESMGVLKRYENIVAPFDGTVTARYADPGALAQNAMNSQTSALPIVMVSRIDRLRVYTYVDQRDARYVKKGELASITVEDRPDFRLEAPVARISGALDSKTRMLLTEIEVDNSKQDLVPGSFVQVSIEVAREPALQVPVESLILRDEKSLVAVVGEDGHVHFREVRVTENNGKTIEVSSGLKEGERVALNIASLGVAEGGIVRPVESGKKG